jgi:hypothetical protein
MASSGRLSGTSRRADHATRLPQALLVWVCGFAVLEVYSRPCQAEISIHTPLWITFFRV